MSAAGRFLRRVAPNAEYSGGYMHWCPACEEAHRYDVPRWTFNGDFERPSFTPSMLIRWGNKVPGYENDQRFVEGDKHDGGICHYFITNGQIAYCSDSTHKMKGQTVPLPDWPYAPGAYGGVED